MHETSSAKDRPNPRKQRSEILTGTTMKKKLEVSEMKIELKNKGEIVKKGKQKKIRPGSKPKKTKNSSKRKTHYEENEHNDHDVSGDGDKFH
jgi:hypothetical protein